MQAPGLAVKDRASLASGEYGAQGGFAAGFPRANWAD